MIANSAIRKLTHLDLTYSTDLSTYVFILRGMHLVCLAFCYECHIGSSGMLVCPQVTDTPSGHEPGCIKYIYL